MRLDATPAQYSGPTSSLPGEPIGYVKQELGHSSIQITVDRYGHFVPGANRSAVDRLAAATDPALSDFDFSSTEDQGGKSSARGRATNG
jgi:hypothetical protein